VRERVRERERERYWNYWWTSTTGWYYLTLQIRSPCILNYMSKWFAVNALSPNRDEINVIKFNVNHL